MIRHAALLTAVAALAIAILALAGCAAFDRPEYQMQRTAVHIQVSEVPFGMTVGADGRIREPAGSYVMLSNGTCLIMLRQYPICLAHEVRHCLEGHFHSGEEHNSDDCF